MIIVTYCKWSEIQIVRINRNFNCSANKFSFILITLAPLCSSCSGGGGAVYLSALLLPSTRKVCAFGANATKDVC